MSINCLFNKLKLSWPDRSGCRRWYVWWYHVWRALRQLWFVGTVLPGPRRSLRRILSHVTARVAATQEAGRRSFQNVSERNLRPAQARVGGAAGLQPACRGGCPWALAYYQGQCQNQRQGCVSEEPPSHPKTCRQQKAAQETKDWGKRQGFQRCEWRGYSQSLLVNKCGRHAGASKFHARLTCQHSNCNAR